MTDRFMVSQALWIASNEMGAIYNPRAIIDDGSMYNFTTMIGRGEGTIYNCSVIIQRNGGLYDSDL